MAHTISASAAGGADTRSRLLAVALELFAANGYGGTSVRDIAERMGVSKAALYYHFASKEEILQAVIGPVIAEYEQLAERAAARPAPAPRDLLAGMVDILSRRTALIRTMMGDPSVPRQLHRPDLQQSLIEGLAAGAGHQDGLRARAAMGAAQFASFTTVMARTTSDPRLARPPDEQRSHELLQGREHLLEEQERLDIVEAALRALSGP